MARLSDQEQVRRDKLQALRDLGINPYPAAEFPINSDSDKIKKDFSEGKKVILAGRLMSRRIQGKASFAEVQDSNGRIQVYFNRDEICKSDDKSLYNLQNLPNNKDKLYLLLKHTLHFLQVYIYLF